MSVTDTITELGLSEEQATAMLREHEDLKRKSRVSEIDARVAELGEKGFKQYPAFLKRVRDVLLSDDTQVALLLSEHDESGDRIREEREDKTASEVVTYLLDALVGEEGFRLSDQQELVSEGGPIGQKPPKDASEEAPVSDRADEAREFLGLSEKKLVGGVR